MRLSALCLAVGAVGIVLGIAACDPAEPPEYLPLGGGGRRVLDRGVFTSSDPDVVALASRDFAEKVCPCLCLLGCPGKEVTALRTEITYEALREGRATIRGTTADGEEIALDFKVERIRRFEVRVVRPELNADEGRIVAEGEPVAVQAGARAVLQVDALGESAVPLGTVEDIEVRTLDANVATAQVARYSRGWRCTLAGVAAGQTTLRVVTPGAAREVPLRVE